MLLGQSITLNMKGQGHSQSQRGTGLRCACDLANHTMLQDEQSVNTLPSAPLCARGHTSHRRPRWPPHSPGSPCSSQLAWHEQPEHLSPCQAGHQCHSQSQGMRGKLTEHLRDGVVANPCGPAKQDTGAAQCPVTRLTLAQRRAEDLQRLKGAQGVLSTFGLAACPCMSDLHTHLRCVPPAPITH